MFIVKNKGKIVLAVDTAEELADKIKFVIHDAIEKTDINYVLYGGEYLTPEQVAEKEHERIQELSMTRSDFFDATIKAFDTDEDDLLLVIKQVLDTLSITDTEKKIAINNYKNALNFYRKHALFTLLSGITLPIGEGVVISSGQWDRFFDKTSKKDPDAYKELIS